MIRNVWPIPYQRGILGLPRWPVLWIDSEMEDAFGHSPNGMAATQLAAEDAARALVAEMAAALGGSVVWRESGVSE